MITHDIPISPEQPIAIITTVQLGYAIQDILCLLYGILEVLLHLLIIGF